MLLKRLKREEGEAIKLQQHFQVVDVTDNNVHIIDIQTTINIDNEEHNLKFKVEYSSNYPFRPPKIALASENNVVVEDIIRRKVRTVCPDIVCWGWQNSPIQFLNPLLLDQWSPRRTVPQLIQYFSFRLGCLSLPEAKDQMLSFAPVVPASCRGIVCVHFGSCGELVGIPSDKSEEMQLNILLDPNIMDDETIVENCNGLVTWNYHQNTYIALGAPYCFNDAEHVDAFLSLLQCLRAKGWNEVYLEQHGIMLTLPTADNIMNLLPTCPFEPSSDAKVVLECGEAIPKCISRYPPGVTPNSYGG